MTNVDDVEQQQASGLALAAREKACDTSCAAQVVSDQSNGEEVGQHATLQPSVPASDLHSDKNGIPRLTELLNGFAKATTKADVDELVHPFKELMSTHDPALVDEASRIVCKKLNSSVEEQQIQGCILVRAVCFANVLSVIVSSDMREFLIKLAFSEEPQTGTVVAVVVDACASIVVRDPSFISEILAPEANRHNVLIEMLSSGCGAGSCHIKGKECVAICNGSENPCVAILNLLSCLVRQRAALKVLLHAGLCTTLANLCWGTRAHSPKATATAGAAAGGPGPRSRLGQLAQTSPPSGTTAAAPAAAEDAGTDAGAGAATVAGAATAGAAAEDASTHAAADSSVSSSTGSTTQTQTPATMSGTQADHAAAPSLADPISPVYLTATQKAALNLTRHLSSHSTLHAQLVQGGILAAMAPVLQAANTWHLSGTTTTPKDQVDGLEIALTVISNVAEVGRPAQQAVLSAPETVHALTQLLTFKDAKVMCHTCDALSSLSLKHHEVQTLIASSLVKLPNTEKTEQSALVVLSKILARPSAPSVLLIRCCHVLGCLVLAHPQNQATLVAAGCVPTLISLMESEQPLLNRHALSCTTNLVAQNVHAQKCVLKMGGVKAISDIIIKSVNADSDPEGMHRGGSSSDLANASASSGDDGGGDERRKRHEERHAADLHGAAERGCDVLTNLVHRFPAAKTAVVEAGVLPPLVQLLSISHKAAAIAAAATLSNVAAQNPEVQSQLVSLGCVQALNELLVYGGNAAASTANPLTGLAPEMTPASSVDDLVAAETSKKAKDEKSAMKLLPTLSAAAHPSACKMVSTASHALGSLMLNHEDNKEVVLASGTLPLLMKMLQVTYAPAVAVSAARTIEIMCRDYPPAKLAVTELDGINTFLALLTDPDSSRAKAASSALISIVQGDRGNQDEIIRCGAADILTPCFKSRDRELVVRSITLLKAIVDQNEDAQTAFGVSGAFTPFLRLLKLKDQGVVELAVMGVNALLKGNRANQLKAASAGLIAPLAVLLDNAKQLSLCRCVVNTWLTLGGLSAMVKLLNHHQPLVVEVSARCIADTLTRAALPSPASSKDASAKGGEPSKGTPAAASPGLSTVINSLIQAKAPAALLEVCRAQQRRKATLEAALVSIKVLAGDTAARAALVDAGAMGVLQRMMGTPAPDLARLAAAASQQLHAPA